MNKLQLTFAILKPHVIKNPIVLNKIREIILNADFKVVRSKSHKFSLEDAQNFYCEHKEKFFYNRLVTFMTSGSSDLYILARNNAIYEWRRLMGPTKVFKTQYEQPNTIRGLYGLSDTRNATHGSDSVESAEKEIGIFFPDFNIKKWYEVEEEKFRNKSLSFCENNFAHKIKN